MKTTFRKSFAKDLKKHSKDKNPLARIQEIILGIESADNITSIKNLKKLKTESSYYRIRVGNYRLGLIIEDETVTFVRILHRREIYRYFP